MAKRPKRTLDAVAAAQHQVEDASKDKFESVREKAIPKPTVQQKNGRLSPQLSCTIEQADKDLLNELAIYMSNKAGRLLNVSTVVRSLIRLGHARKNELEL